MMSVNTEPKSLQIESVSSFRSVCVSVGLSLLLVTVSGLFLNALSPWDYARTGLLYFQQVEGISFFLMAFVFLLVVSRKRPNWRLERIFFRLICVLITISSLSVLISLSSREFAQVFLFGFAGLILLWVFFGNFLRVALICLSIVIALLVIPFDVIFSSPMRSIEGRSASIQLLEAQYGLVRETAPGTYSMGCIVPPNPVAWVLWIDLWPLVDQAFRTYDGFFQFNNKLAK